ncbi:dTDP-4-dehydrorhamnose 3,5-epimerase family protein [Amycolatopsis sp. H6(2020)]|nr:dTDP-4-dehydrorhamnose 3,5-epimerase family protein [Amycolatopsis sp. H6(2020)]
MAIRSLRVEGAYVVTSQVFTDERGYFLSPYLENDFQRCTGHKLFAVSQSSLNRSRSGVVRGIHYTAAPPGMTKFAFSPHGKALDVLVDLRVGSPTFGEWDSVVLDQQSFRSVYVPMGVGHMTVALADETLVCYLLSTGYVAENERAVSPLDPDLGLPLPSDLELVLSERDRAAPTLAEAERAGLLPDYAVCRRLDAQGNQQ